MNVETFYGLRNLVLAAGYGEEIDWQQDVEECSCVDEFVWNAVWVIISSGMKNQIARIIETRIIEAWNNHQPLGEAFGHKGKVKAIEYIIANGERLFLEYSEAEDKLAYLETLPFIGGITKYHLAKNLGEDVVKPDRHLVRIAEYYNMTPRNLCEKLSRETAYRIGTVDLIIWRAANLGYI